MLFPYTFIAEHAEKLYDHENDTRPSEVERIVLLTDEQLAALRAPAQVDGCDRGCDRRGINLVELDGLRVRIVCDRCIQDVECACGCGKVMPRWQTTTVGGETFGPKCCGVEPGESW
jgi:hypothetical protein